MEEPIIPANRDYGKEVSEGLAILWDTAKRVVYHIQEFKPGAVISLLHSGWAPVKASRMIWEEIKSEPFPPVVKTNLGREKISAYPGESSKTGNINFKGMYSEDFQIGHFLAWLVGQDAWQAELKAQIEAQLTAGRAPERIMLVDDWIAEGNTFILALGLMDILYPAAEKRYVTGDYSWKMGFGRLWLQRFHPQLLDLLDLPESAGGLSEGERHTFENHLYRLIPGTEDVDVTSFEWKPISVSSQIVLELSAYLPSEKWLHLPQFVVAEIEKFFKEKLYDYRRGVLDDDILPDRIEESYLPALEHKFLILRDLWLNPQGIGREWIIEKYGMSPGQASRLLEKMLRRGFLIRKGRGRAARYHLHPGVLDPAVDSRVFPSQT